MSNRPKLILSMPSSGSDFFARSVAEATDWSYYDKEWFNPICNLKHFDELQQDGFFCESPSCQDNMYDTVHSRRMYWKFLDTGHKLNKEVFNFAKWRWFSQRFDIVCLVRTKQTMFPPSRLRVLQWYESICTAVSPYDVHTNTFLERVDKGYNIAINYLMRPEVPMIWYEDLMKDEPDVRPIATWLGGESVVSNLVDVLKKNRKSDQKPLEPNSVVYNGGGGLVLNSNLGAEQ